MTARYAIYFSPLQHSPWWKFGAHWLGRDECEDKALSQTLPTQFDAANFYAMTSEPRRYGFHATLKAPFHLRGGHTADDLLARMRGLAATLQPLALGPLQAVTLGKFAALVPVTPSDQLAALATACVTEFEALREPLSQAERARRRTQRLDARELELLEQFGYPYVLERFRFHFTLSGPVHASAAELIMQAVAQPVAMLNATEPLVLNQLCLFVESAPGQPFRCLATARLSA
jgi:putative phosphonate metabolism protein